MTSEKVLLMKLKENAWLMVLLSFSIATMAVSGCVNQNKIEQQLSHIEQKINELKGKNNDQ